MKKQKAPDNKIAAFTEKSKKINARDGLKEKSVLEFDDGLKSICLLPTIGKV